MNIAFFTDTYFPQINGVTISIRNYTTVLQKMGHKVYIFAPAMPYCPSEEKEVIRISSLKVLSSEPEVRVPIPRLSREYQKMFDLPIDIIHAHGNGAFSLLGLQIARMRSIPFVMTFHTIHTHYGHYVFDGKVLTQDMIISAMRWFGNRCDGILTPSIKMKQELLEYGITKPIQIMPNFIFSKEFEHKHTGYLRDKYSIPKGHKILLSVGRLGKEKNFEFLLRVTKKLHQTHPDTHLVIVGKGPYEKVLTALAKKLGIAKFVHITGIIPRTEVPLCYYDADMFVFASRSETQGMVLLEAAAAKLPMVVVDDPAFDGIAVHNKTSFRLPLKQDAFVAYIENFLESPALCHEFGIEAARALKNNFDPNVLTTTLLTYYQSIISAHPRRQPLMKQFIDRTAVRRISTTLNAISNFFVNK